MSIPLVWTDAELTNANEESTTIFRRERIDEPLEAYNEQFDKHQILFEELLEATVDLTQLNDMSAELFANPDMLMPFRYLAAPPISEDDLEILAEVQHLTAAKLKSDPELRQRVVGVILAVLDRRRFPWVATSPDQPAEEPSEKDKYAAILASSALVANQRVQTGRRSLGKTTQENMVRDCLIALGFQQVKTRRISELVQAPKPGEFCGESTFGSRKADFVIGLWDNRIMAIECKVSNSVTNSIKRITNDAAVKAVRWKEDFGKRQVIPAAVLSGVFALNILKSAQDNGLTLFWAHQLNTLTEWIETTRPPKKR